MNIRPSIIAGLAALFIGSGFAPASLAHERGHSQDNHHPSYRSFRHARPDSRHHYDRRVPRYNHSYNHRHYNGCRHSSHYGHHQRDHYPQVRGQYYYRQHGHDGLSLRLQF